MKMNYSTLSKFKTLTMLLKFVKTQCIASLQILMRKGVEARSFLFLLTSIISHLSTAQYAPPAGQVGSLAIHKDSNVFKAWASGCVVEAGYQDIADKSLGRAATGDSSSAVGKAGENGTVSLGDSGIAILTFSDPIQNGEGADFAVFENGFSDTFLELAFVEVSSDGEHYVRFASVSNTQDTAQIQTFGLLDATKIHNLAGKYRALYGTPFDLEELKDSANLDVNAITHIKIIDVIGTLDTVFASKDSKGKTINDPYPTAFPQSGFDLDAIGVINNGNAGIKNNALATQLLVYPTMVSDFVYVRNKDSNIRNIEILNGLGQSVDVFEISRKETAIPLANYPKGVYILKITTENTVILKKIIKSL